MNDGTRFEIYKRYIDRQDIDGWATKYGVRLAIEHFGTAFVAVSGETCPSGLRDGVEVFEAAQEDLVVHQRRRCVEPVVQGVPGENLERRS